jgi:hypothetical protein
MTELVQSEHVAHPDFKWSQKYRLAHRRAFVLRHTIAGYSIADIVEMYNREISEINPDFAVGESAIYGDRQDVMRELTSQAKRSIEEWRALLLERHEFVLRNLYPKVETGHIAATKLWLSTISQMATLTGANLEKETHPDPKLLSDDERKAQVMRFLEIARERARANRGDVIEGEVVGLLGESDGRYNA